MKKLRGYITSRPFLGERVPQHVQNLVIRDYCQKFDYQYLLSATEYAMDDSFLMLENILLELPEIDGIISYSMFQLPADGNARNSVYQMIINQGKSLHFAVENAKINNAQSAQLIEQMWMIKRTLPNCLTTNQLQNGQ